MRHIALTGLARAGKDSIAARLVEAHGYKRVAFADPLKAMALKIDPMLGVVHERTDDVYTFHLAEIVKQYGWEFAKDVFPEVRRFLQNLGQSIREASPEFWIDLALADINRHRLAGYPIVVSDVRYRNEAQALQHLGFELVRVMRPGVVSDGHVSESEMTDYKTGYTIWNGGTLDDLVNAVDDLVSSK